MKYPLSHSAYNTYQTCQRKWKLNYVDKIKPRWTPSYFVFGSAIDKAIGLILIGKGTDEALMAAKIEIMRLGSEEVILEAKDFDLDIIQGDYRQKLYDRLKPLGWGGSDLQTVVEELSKKQQEVARLSDNDLKLLTLCIQFSMSAKAALFIDAFVTRIMPQIKEIHGIQTKVKRGYLDFEATFEEYGRVIVDIKTASRPYADDAVKYSVQLAGYQAEKAMYIVFDKNIVKVRHKVCEQCGHDGTGGRHKTCNNEVDGARCNGAWVESIELAVVPQVLVDDIPLNTRKLVEDAYAATEKDIDAKLESGAEFPCNLNACKNQYGKPCDYIKFCWQGKMDGLKESDTDGKWR
jgi:hypothetical protein